MEVNVIKPSRVCARFLFSAVTLLVCSVSLSALGQQGDGTPPIVDEAGAVLVLKQLDAAIVRMHQFDDPTEMVKDITDAACAITAYLLRDDIIGALKDLPSDLKRRTDGQVAIRWDIDDFLEFVDVELYFIRSLVPGISELTLTWLESRLWSFWSTTPNGIDISAVTSNFLTPSDIVTINNTVCGNSDRIGPRAAFYRVLSTLEFAGGVGLVVLDATPLVAAAPPAAASSILLGGMTAKSGYESMKYWFSRD